MYGVCMNKMNGPKCTLCGRNMRVGVKREFCRIHGEKGYLGGVCAKCGEKVPPAQRGHHSSSSCGERSIWNKGRTARETPSLISPFKGKKRPELAVKVREAWTDPKIRERYRRGMSKGQRRRFERPEQREASRVMARKLVELGAIVPYGGRTHGNGRLATTSERQMLKRLEREGFEPEFVVPLGSERGPGRPNHYKLDLANVVKKIAVEFDGSSHGTRVRRASDARKDAVLRALGWRVVRLREPFDYDVSARELRELVLSTVVGCTT